MTYEETLSWLNGYSRSAWKLGLERETVLMEKLGNPQKGLTFIHVGGSNGKGSTCAMLERILREAGYKTGFFPSPYLEDFRERIQVNGEMIPKETLCALTERVRDAASTMEDAPTHFELVTAIGFLYFAAQKCDIVVLEVGLGGEFDATNVIETPVAAVLTHIGLEHTEYLGNSLREIAATKGGIIKPGGTVVCYENDPEVMETVAGICQERGSALRVAAYDRLTPLESTLDGQTFTWRDGTGEQTLSLSLPGAYQLRNAATVLTVVEVLREKGFALSAEAVKTGLLLVRWPARFEVLGRNPLFILDGGHNPQCAEALRESVETYLGDGKVVFLMGVLRDKDVDAIIETVAPCAREFVCATPDSPRAMPAAALARKLTERGIPAVPCGSVAEAIRESIQRADGAPVVAFGSLYMAGAIRTVFRGMRGGQEAQDE